MDTEKANRSEITIVFKVSLEEYNRAEQYIGDEKYRHYWARNAFFEKVSRMEANDKDSRIRKMKTDAAYIQELIDQGYISVRKH
jgi:hypothetical protein